MGRLQPSTECHPFLQDELQHRCSSPRAPSTGAALPIGAGASAAIARTTRAFALRGLQKSAILSVRRPSGAGYSHSHVSELQTLPPGHPAQSGGHKQAQSFEASQIDRLPVHESEQSGAHSQAHVDGLHTSAAPVQIPPQPEGHWQLQEAPSQSRLVPAHTPPQSASHSQAQLVGSQTVPAGQPPQSDGHSQAQVFALQTSLAPQLPPQSGAQAQLQSSSQTSLGPQFALQVA